MLADEDLVHRLGPHCDDRPDLVAINHLGDVARVAASSLVQTGRVAAESSCGGTAPMMSMSGSRTSRWVLTV